MRAGRTRNGDRSDEHRSRREEPLLATCLCSGSVRARASSVSKSNDSDSLTWARTDGMDEDLDEPIVGDSRSLSLPQEIHAAPTASAPV